MASRRYRLKKKFGLSLEDYEAMRDVQDARCALCGTNEPNEWQSQ